MGAKMSKAHITEIEGLKRVFIACKVKDIMRVYFNTTYDFINKKPISVVPRHRD